MFKSVLIEKKKNSLSIYLPFLECPIVEVNKSNSERLIPFGRLDRVCRRG